jgi:hypothetical protein
MSDERAKRLRNKRNAAKDKAAETAETAEPDEPSEPSKPPEHDESDESDETDEPDETDNDSVKDENVGVYMYLPEEQKNEVSYQFDRLKAEYKRETGEELEKNRHFYPLLITHGLDSLEDWDGSDVKERIGD